MCSPSSPTAEESPPAPAIGQRPDQRVGAVEQFEEQVGDQSLDDRVADLHGGAGHLAGRGVHRHGGERRPADAVAPGGPADHHDAVAGLQSGQFVIAGQNLTHATAENERVGRVAGVVEDRAGHGGDAHFVAVVRHALDHAFLDDRRVEHAGGKFMVVEIPRAEAEDVGQGDRPRGGGENIADDTAHPGVGAAERLDGARVVVGLGLDREPLAVGKGHDARIAVESGDNEGGGDFFCRLAQLAQQGDDLAVAGRDARAESFVRAVVTPGLRDGFQFRIGRIASGGGEPLRHDGHFRGIEGERTLRIDTPQFRGTQTAQRHEVDRGGILVRPAGKAGQDGPGRPCFDDRIAQEVVHEKAQVLFRQVPRSGDGKLRPGGRLDLQPAAGRTFGQLHGHAIGHPGPPRHFDGQAVRIGHGRAGVESRRFARHLVNQPRHQLPQTRGVCIAAQEKDFRRLDRYLREPQLAGLPGQSTVAVRTGRFDDFGDVTHGPTRR